jgi:hypothetical protein
MKITKKDIIDNLEAIKKQLKNIEGHIDNIEKEEIKWTRLGDLEWSECLGEMDWNTAVKKCEELGGRLPTRVELVELFDNHYEELQLLNSPGYDFWSSTEHCSTPANAWIVSLHSGYTLNYTKVTGNYVRCVRQIIN